MTKAEVLILGELLMLLSCSPQLCLRPTSGIVPNQLIHPNRVLDCRDNGNKFLDKCLPVYRKSATL